MFPYEFTKEFEDEWRPKPIETVTLSLQRISSALHDKSLLMGRISMTSS
jgi:hypothetical protein